MLRNRTEISATHIASPGSFVVIHNRPYIIREDAEGKHQLHPIDQEDVVGKVSSTMGSKRKSMESASSTTWASLDDPAAKRVKSSNTKSGEAGPSCIVYKFSAVEPGSKRGSYPVVSAVSKEKFEESTTSSYIPTPTKRPFIDLAQHLGVTGTTVVTHDCSGGETISVKKYDTSKTLTPGPVVYVVSKRSKRATSSLDKK